MTGLGSVVGADDDHATRGEVICVDVEMQWISSIPATAEKEDHRWVATIFVETLWMENMQLQFRHRTRHLFINQDFVRGKASSALILQSLSEANQW